MKFLLIDRMRRSQSLSWSSAEAKSADLMYGSLGEDGLFFRMAAAGHVIGMPTEAQLAHFMQEPPEETRAYLRAHLLRRFGEHVVGMNWDQMRFRVSNSPIWYSEAVLEMPDPLSCGRWECGPILQRSSDLEELLESLTSAPFASS
jgi:proteasome accessory factor A